MLETNKNRLAFLAFALCTLRVLTAPRLSRRIYCCAIQYNNTNECFFCGKDIQPSRATVQQESPLLFHIDISWTYCTGLSYRILFACSSYTHTHTSGLFPFFIEALSFFLLYVSAVLRFTWNFQSPPELIIPSSKSFLHPIFIYRS